MKLNKKQIFSRLGEVDDAFIDESALPKEPIAIRHKPRHIISDFFEKPAVVVAICAIVAFGTVTGIVMAGRAAGRPVPPIGGTADNDHPSQETEFAYVGDVIRHEDLYYVSYGDGTCSLVGIAALPEDMVLTIPEIAMNGDRVISLRDMTMTSSLMVPNGVHLLQIKGIHIPASMTDVHIGTLHEMTALESLTVDEENPVYRAEKNSLIEKERERLVYAYLEFVAPPTSPPWQDYQLTPYFSFIIPDSVKIIATNALHYDIDCASDKTSDVIYGAGVDALNVSPISFPTQIHIPASVEHIEERFFVNHDYASISLSVDKNNPAYYAESNCLIRKDSNTLILGGKNAEIPNSVTAIAPYAFWGTGLETIHIPASVQSVGELAFWNNPDLESITGDVCAMPKVELNLDVDGTFACYYVQENCLVLGEIKVTDGSVTTSHTLVLGCTHSVVPAQVTAIGDYAFAWNQELTEIDLPAGLQSIGFKAFAHCPNLRTIRYSDTYESWCRIAMGNAWLHDNGLMIEVYFSDTNIPMTVVGVELDYTGKGTSQP